MTWTLEYAQSVARYLIDLRESGADVRKAIRSLAQGIPEEAQQIQEQPETWKWLEARHWITFIVDHSRHWIYISHVESATIE